MRNSIDRYFLVSVLVLVSLASLVRVIRAAHYVPTEKFLLNCGDTSLATAEDGRKWAPDVGSKFLGVGNSVVSKAATQDPAVPVVPYMSARVFQSNFTYSFPVVAGRKFIRLYFYSSSYDGLNAANALFSVTSGSYTLLQNFSASQTSEALNYAFLIKEYSVNVDGEMLNITFSPSSTASNAYAFVNGIEVMSMPDIYSSTDESLMIVGYTTFTIDNSTALETVYRLNVGGNDISPSEDGTGLFRSWSNDLPYIFGAGVGVRVAADPNMTFNYKGISPYIAPKTVFATARSMGPYSAVNAQSNLTWFFSVDSGFNYLIRLHFCEFTEIINLINQRAFNIFLNNQTAQKGADVIAWAGGNWNIGVPVYKDFVVLVPAGGAPQQDLWLELHPDIAAKPQYYDAILNGVEIFKISHKSGNLAGLNPIPAPKNEVNPSLALPPHSGHSNLKAITAVGVSGGVALAVVVGFYVFAASHRRKHGVVPSASDDPENTALIQSDKHEHKNIE